MRTAANAATLMDSPILVGHLRQWRFVEGGVPHRVVYWPLPNATPFDTTAFVSGIQRLVRQALALFGRAPYREYTFLFEDGAFSGGLVSGFERPAVRIEGTPNNIGQAWVNGRD